MTNFIINYSTILYFYTNCILIIFIDSYIVKICFKQTIIDILSKFKGWLCEFFLHLPYFVQICKNGLQVSWLTFNL